MVVVMGVLAVLLILTAGIAELSVQFTKGSGQDRDRKRALAAANAGAKIATYRLSATGASDNQCFTTVGVAPAGCPAQASGDLGNGATYKYYVSPVLAAGDSCTGPTVAGTKTVAQRCVTSVGTVNGSTRRVQMRIVAYPPVLRFPVNGILGLSGITLSGAPNITGDLGANGNISISGGSAVVNGSIRRGTATTTYSGPTPSGGIKPVESQKFSGVSDTAAFEKAESDNDNAQLFPLPANVTLTNNELTASNKVATLASPWVWQSGNYYFCNMRFPNDTYIKLAAGAKVHVFVDSPYRTGSPCAAGTGNVDITGKFYLDNPSTDPLNLQFEVYGDPACTTAGCNSPYLKFNNVLNGSSSPLYATFFAPWSFFTTTNTSYIVGGIVANRVVASNSLTFNAQGLSGLTNGVSAFFPSSWRECRRSPSTTDPGSNC
jgi:Tfp pilus assembly protein PilX